MITDEEKKQAMRNLELVDLHVRLLSAQRILLDIEKEIFTIITEDFLLRRPGHTDDDREIIRIKKDQVLAEREELYRRSQMSFHQLKTHIEKNGHPPDAAFLENIGPDLNALLAKLKDYFS